MTYHPIRRQSATLAARLDVRRLVIWCGLWGAFLLLGGCAAGMGAGSQPSGAAADEALLSIYLETQGDCAAELSLSLGDLVLRSDQADLPLFLEPVTVERSQARGRQTLLGLARVPAGYYNELDLTFELPAVAGREAGSQVVTMRFAKAIFLEGGDSRCLFITWHLDDCLDSAGRFSPKFSARGQGEPLSGDLLYALSSDINTLYLVRTDTRFVTAAIGLDGRVEELAIDPQRRLLYLVNSARRSLQVFDLATHRLIDRLPLPLTLEPAHIALDLAGNHAFVSDPLARRVVKIDLDSGQMVAHQQVGLQPGRLIFIEQDGAGLVAVCAPRTQQVFLLNAETLLTQRSLDTGLQPGHLLFTDDRLYVAEAGSRTVTIFDLSTGRQAGQVRMTGVPGEMLANTADGKVYVNLDRPPSLGVLGAGQLISLRSIAVGAGPGALALSERRGQIYVANPATRSVTVLDRASERQMVIIPLGGAVADLVVFD